MDCLCCRNYGPISLFSSFLYLAIRRPLGPVFLSEELWTEVRNIVQETVVNIISKKKKRKKTKWLSEQTLQIAEKRKEAKGKGEK